jgi:hypothetical protein
VELAQQSEHGLKLLVVCANTMPENTNMQDTPATVAEGSDPDARIDALENLVATMASENDRLATKLEKLESLVVSQSQSIESLKGDLGNIKDEQKEIAFFNSKQDAGLARRLTKLEETLEADVDYRIEANLSPIERYLLWGPEATQVQNTATVRRASVLVDNFQDWAATGAGTGTLHILSKSNWGISLRERMRDACEESLDWVQIYRAMEKAAALSDGKFVYEKDRKVGHILTLVSGESPPITTEQHLMEVDAQLSANGSQDDE